MRISILSSLTVEKLENEVEEWMIKNADDFEPIDIKFEVNNTEHGITIFYAMVVYKWGE